MKPGEEIEVRTPNAVAAVRGTVFVVEVDPIKAGDAHAYVLLPLAAIAVVIALMAIISRRWQLGRLVSVIGLAGIAISLAIDLPKGLDAGTAGNAFAGAKATLTNGFYAQLAASAFFPGNHEGGDDHGRRGQRQSGEDVDQVMPA